MSVASAREPPSSAEPGTAQRRHVDLVRQAILAASSHNTQPWKFRLEPDAISILPDLSRRYLSVAYEYLRLDKHNPPSTYGAGTTPELVVFGALLDFGFDFPLGSERSFGFQSNLLGGRHLPGGTVSDFVVWNGGSRVGVYVDSVFHTPSFVWAGREKVEYERVLAERVIARTDITVVMRINRIELGMPLENGPDELVEREFERLLSA